MRLKRRTRRNTATAMFNVVGLLLMSAFMAYIVGTVIGGAYMEGTADGVQLVGYLVAFVTLYQLTFWTRRRDRRHRAASHKTAR